MKTKTTEATYLLVDSCWGIYSYQVLGSRHELYTDGELLKDLAFLNPDECLDNDVDKLHVKIDGNLWQVEEVDGDLFAINPEAVWDDTYGWVLPEDGGGGK